ncbi:MAG: hypothetical protein IJX99_04120 [Clostridia bacterium]|nr:hypothetical protein [Clostridia bacterium]
MKKYISKNWQKILRIGGYICLGLIIFLKLNAEKTVLKDYIKYGKEVTPTKGSGILSGVKDNFVTTFTSVDSQLVKFAIIFIAAITIVVFFTSLLDRKKDTKKK